MEVKTVLSQRGANLLIVEGFKFRKIYKLSVGEVLWRCTNKQCKAKLYTLGDEHLISKSELVHNHDLNSATLSRQIITCSAKRKATEDLAEKPSKIISSAIKENSSELGNLTIKDLTLIRNSVYYNRRKVQPQLPKNIEDVFGALELLDIKTIKKEPFLLIADIINKIVVFSCETNLRVLCNSPKVYMDGTFKYCCKYFYQLFTIHILQNGHYIPLVFVLLPNKETRTYATMLKLIQTKCSELNLIFKPKFVVVDFEKAIHNAISNIWPDAIIQGCKFHLTQAWYRKILNLGLSKEYKDCESETGKWLKYLFGLPYLNPTEVGDAFVFDFVEIQPKDDRISKLSDYLVDTYLNEDSDFPPSMWAAASASAERTTNACESFHAHFNESFYNKHPHIFQFLEVLGRFQTNTYIAIQSMHEKREIRNSHVKKRMEFISKKLEEYRQNPQQRFHFVKCVSFTNKL